MRTPEILFPTDRSDRSDPPPSPPAKEKGERFAACIETLRQQRQEHRGNDVRVNRPARPGPPGVAPIPVASEAASEAPRLSGQDSSSSPQRDTSSALVDEGEPGLTNPEEKDRQTQNEPPANAAPLASAPPNIIHLPLVPVIIPFPGPANSPEGSGGGAAIDGRASAETGAASPVLALSVGMDNGEVPAANAQTAEGHVTANPSGESSPPAFRVIDGGLKQFANREQLAEGLRQAMAQLEELQEQTPSATGGSDRIIPFPASSSAGARANVIPVDFTPVPPTEDAPDSARVVDATQLPVHSASQEKPAEEPAVPGGDAKVADVRTKATKPALDGGLTALSSTPSSRPETAGISAARQEIRMESRASNEQQSFAGQDPDEVGGETVPARPGAESAENASNPRHAPWVAEAMVPPGGRTLIDPSNRNADIAPTVDRMAQLITREVAHIRQHGSDSMAVVLRPDDNTELFLHVSHRNGQIEASVRCERGDFGHLNALWSQLQESLGQQKIRLASLQGSASDTQLFRYPGGSPGEGGSSPRQQQPPPQEDFVDDWPTSASPANNPAHVRSRRGSRHRLTTSRPGWETWA